MLSQHLPPMLPLFLFMTHVIIMTTAEPPLRPGYYSETCPEAESTVRKVLKEAMIREPRSGASVMRFQFHDCFVNVKFSLILFFVSYRFVSLNLVLIVLRILLNLQGCDGSMLLDDTPDMLGEKLSLSNINSLRSYEVVDEIKEALESVCPGIVSCADIIIMASRDAVALVSNLYLSPLISFVSVTRKFNKKTNQNFVFCYDVI